MASAVGHGLRMPIHQVPLVHIYWSIKPHRVIQAGSAWVLWKLIELDKRQAIYEAIWKRFSGSIRMLIDNKYVFSPFWSYHNEVLGYDDWEDRFRKSKVHLHKALQNHDTRMILATVFDRLYVLRNQIVHGGATWNSSVNRSQIRDGHEILAFLVPLFIDLMMDNPDKNWGAPYYPVIE